MNKGEATYIPLAEAAQKSGYTAEYLRQLCVKGKIAGVKIGKTWTVTPAVLENFLKQIGQTRLTFGEVVGSNISQWPLIQKIAAYVLCTTVFLPVVVSFLDVPTRINQAKSVYAELVALNNPSLLYDSQLEYLQTIVSTMIS